MAKNEKEDTLQEPVFTSVPIQEPIAEGAPKRGPGRPRLTDEERAARGQKPRGERSPRRSLASLETRIGAMLSQINMALMIVPYTRADALDPAEITMLARSIDEQCKSSPTLRKYVEAMVSVSSGGQLLTVAAFIGARRAARHHYLPVSFDDMLGAQLATMAGVPVTPSPVIEKKEPEPNPDPENDILTEP